MIQPHFGSSVPEQNIPLLTAQVTNFLQKKSLIFFFFTELPKWCIEITLKFSFWPSQKEVFSQLENSRQPFMLRLFSADAIQASNVLKSQDKHISSTLAERSGTRVKILQIKEGEYTFKANFS